MQTGPPSSGYAAQQQDKRAQEEEEIRRQFDLIYRTPTGDSSDGGGLRDLTERVQRWKEAVRQVAASKGLKEERVEAVQHRVQALLK